MEITLYRANGTRNATFFMFIQRQTAHMKASGKLGIWIPKSQFTIKESGENKAWNWTECKVIVSDWFARKNDILNRQIHIQKHHQKKVDEPKPL